MKHYMPTTNYHSRKSTLYKYVSTDRKSYKVLESVVNTHIHPFRSVKSSRLSISILFTYFYFSGFKMKNVLLLFMFIKMDFTSKTFLTITHG